MNLGHNSIGHLKRIVDRVEDIEVEIAALNKEKSTVYKQAKDTGLVPKVIKKVIAARRQKPEDRKEATVLFDTYFKEIDSAPPGAEAEEGNPASPPTTKPLPPTAPETEEETTTVAEVPHYPSTDAEMEEVEEGVRSRAAAKVPPEEPDPEEDGDPFGESEPQPHGPEVTKSTFGSSDLDGADDTSPDPENADEQEDKPKINMEFPDGAVPDEFGQGYD